MNILTTAGPFYYNEFIKILEKHNIKYIPAREPYNSSNYTLIIGNNWDCKILVKKMYKTTLVWNESFIDKNGKLVFAFEVLIKENPEIKNDLNKLKPVISK